MKREFAYLITILMAITMVLACGDGGGNKHKPPGIGPQGEIVGITCADAIQTYGEPCDAIQISKPGRSANIFTIGNAPSATFQSGDLIYNSFVLTEVEVDNYTVQWHRFYVHRDDSHVKGCESQNGTMTTYPFDLPPAATQNYGTSGSNFAICAEKNAVDSYITVTLYNASHLADDELGDPAVDEPFYNTTIYFSLVNSIAYP